MSAYHLLPPHPTTLLLPDTSAELVKFHLLELIIERRMHRILIRAHAKITSSQHKEESCDAGNSL